MYEINWIVVACIYMLSCVTTLWQEYDKVERVSNCTYAIREHHWGKLYDFRVTHVSNILPRLVLFLTLHAYTVQLL